MPNYAENKLTISGAPGRLAELQAFIAGEDEYGKLTFDFEKVIPTPEELANATSSHPPSADAARLKATYGFPSWYEFRIEQWGTKWNIREDTLSVKEEGDDQDPFLRKLTLTFDTAWAPPTGIIEALGRKFTDLKFELYACDPGMDYAWYMLMYGGVLEDCSNIPYDQTIKDMFGHQPWEEDEEETEESTI